MLLLLQNSPLAFAALAGILGLLVGSFLNVVIHRLPKMMERDWHAQCAELNGQTAAPAARYNLLVPRSACPHCGHAIAAMENVPVLSYLFLKGKQGLRCCHLAALSHRGSGQRHPEMIIC